jgi:Family of unknown function (DUF6088)
METARRKRTAGAAATVRTRIEKGGERYWRHTDFLDLPATAVTQALHRLERAGLVTHVRKGLYYRGRDTTFGPSIPAHSDIAARSVRAALQPAGLTASNALGLTTQNPARPEYATTSGRIPTAITGAVVHTRRPSSRAGLTALEGAVLEVLRERGRTSDLSPTDTVRRLRKVLGAKSMFDRVAAAAGEEPPRVRAMLGAFGQEMRANPKALARLRRSLNPLSRFDFGELRELRYAKEWQAR